MKPLLFLLASFQSFAQEPQAAIEIPEFNLLYRGYPNKLVPAVTDNNGREVILFGSPDIIIQKENDDQYYTVKPTGKGRIALLYVGLKKGDSIDTIRTIEYRAVNLPDPSLYWGGVKQGAQANIRQRKLFAKYPPEIPLSAAFSIVNWQIDWNGKQIQGTGSNISTAEEFFKTIEEETIFKCG